MLSRTEAEEPTGTKGRLGGFLPRRTQTRPGRVAAFRLEVPPERAKTLRRKERSFFGGMPAITLTRRVGNAPADLGGRDSACRCVGESSRRFGNVRRAPGDACS